MEEKNTPRENSLLPNLAAPVRRSTTGFNPNQLEELSEEELTGTWGLGGVHPLGMSSIGACFTPFAGDDAE